ncbi:hypothetical protein [Wenyingzhuangia aestuarii]|uniref:hypothetical protein n=1 Tax=Wenyingzhuangia aestuarii TaxID=1647582 RepID=UPI00143B5957|nr:hypothetical protein [Wenyingzhuangia aestuarii]NJB83775.1 hypothetical protein [Wenyingzhuangia aestuarii]
MNAFHQTLKHWYDKSKLGLVGRELKEQELFKRKELLEHAEYNPDFSINMINVCGVYEIVGGNPDIKDSYYTGLLNIDLISNQIEANWLIEGEQQQTGYGFVFNNTLVISFNYSVENEYFNGIVAYSFITPDVVIGKWTEEIAIENAFEMCRKLTADELGEPNQEDYFSAN